MYGDDKDSKNRGNANEESQAWVISRVASINEGANTKESCRPQAQVTRVAKNNGGDRVPRVGLPTRQQQGHQWVDE